MSDTYQVCESCAHRFAVPIGARASKCETCASLDRKDAELTRLHAEAAELRAELDMERNANAKVELALYDAKAEVERVRLVLERIASVDKASFLYSPLAMQDMARAALAPTPPAPQQEKHRD